jgi:hypothetical protein
MAIRLMLLDMLDHVTWRFSRLIESDSLKNVAHEVR